jgi:hypothetical protein
MWEDLGKQQGNPGSTSPAKSGSVSAWFFAEQGCPDPFHCMLGTPRHPETGVTVWNARAAIRVLIADLEPSNTF